LQNFYMGRILNFGHRGASYDAPMNTLPAFQLAAQQGADGVELDVMFSADRQVVVIHDETVDHTTDASGQVADFTLAQLKELDAGSFKGPQFAGVRIPTLDEVFEAVGQRLLINVELKGLSLQADGLEAEVAAIIRRHGMESRVIISSFNPMRLRRFRQAAPQIPVGFLHADDSPLALRLGASALMLGFKHEADHPEQSTVTQQYVAWARRHQYRVNTWVANDPDRMATLRDLGVDLIMTDRPDLLRAVLHGER
jgi:glycerophosphoryl diester phosphodiesterase